MTQMDGNKNPSGSKWTQRETLKIGEMKICIKIIVTRWTTINLKKNWANLQTQMEIKCALNL